MDSITNLFEIDYVAVFVSICTILVAFKTLSSLFEWFINKWGLETKGMRRGREKEDLLIATADELKILREQRKEDVAQSIRHDELIKKDLVNVMDLVNEINNKLDAMEKKNDESERTRLKDRIAQAYRKYSESGEWTEMDKESYEGLIKDYEAHGGENSFVHKICEPESYTWKIID